MAEPAGLARSRAILIGTATYQDPAFLPLPAAANSLAQMRDVLTDARLCGWPPEQVEVLADPTDARRLVQNFAEFCQASGSLCGDRLVQDAG